MSLTKHGIEPCPYCGRAIAHDRVCGTCGLAGRQHTPKHPHLLCTTELLRDVFGPMEQEHRLEHVATIDGVHYVNDSRSTNVNSTWFALESTNGPIIWLAGGDRGARWSQRAYQPLRDLVKQKVKALYDFGPLDQKLFPHFRSDTIALPSATLHEAVVAARILAEPGDTVLLSPACASFHAFANLEERGRSFKHYVLNP